VAYYSHAANRTRSYSLNRLAINLGWAVGASLGGIIAGYDYELLFWVDGITNMFAALVMYVFLRPSRAVVKEKIEEAEVPLHHSAYRDKTYLWFILFTTIFGLCFFQLFTTIPKYFRDNLFLSERYIGFMMAVNGLLIVGVEMVLVYILERKNKMIRFISAGTFICGLSYFSLLLPGDARWITLIMILLISFGEIISMPFMNSFWIARSNEKNRGQYAALYTISWGIGQTVGPFLCSKLVEASNFETLFVVLGMALGIAAWGFSRLSPSPVNTQTSEISGGSAI
jgi:predicted MFS family arabinose efflux permease